MDEDGGSLDVDADQRRGSMPFTFASSSGLVDRRGSLLAESPEDGEAYKEQHPPPFFSSQQFGFGSVDGKWNGPTFAYPDANSKSTLVPFHIAGRR